MFDLVKKLQKKIVHLNAPLEVKSSLMILYLHFCGDLDAKYFRRQDVYE